ncbi:EAL domain-containing protein [Butyrivibrio sp. MC2021]|uniref:EAL domain-containing protein n=1 Tax=Butyrivibrio sp. MC2021 TaxID=1408306 RepID=UPI0006871A91|nr:EAL domain-containing protein [Butyrivibrio sp. MC2021]
MQRQLTTQELLDRFDEAISNGYIFAYYQPQFNHATGSMTGAEALMRWIDPEYGMQYPSDFIPVLEEHDLLYKADIQMVESACRFIRNCIDDDISVVPISFNMSRNDIFKHSYVDDVEKVRQKYNVPVKYLRVEITETSAIGGMELMVSVIDKFHKLGYIVEMDDFGSGYSSLNILKDLDVDIIKLDLNFLNGNVSGRGGIIIRSVVQMAKWLRTPIIVEGVETLEQADFMKSIGCYYIQGYLYSKPVPEDEFLEKMSIAYHEPTKSPSELIKTFKADNFWDPNSLETLIFNNFVGGAAVFSYNKEKLEFIRVNRKYIEEIGMNISERDFIESNPWKYFETDSKKVFVDTIEKAISSAEEEVCESWMLLNSKCCGTDQMCIRYHLRVIGNAGDEYLIYAIISNITAEKKSFQDVFESERKFRYASEHTKSYAWEYTIATKEMRPCFRCMRDLGLPPLIKNYPEPVIESGLFQPDYADMYREWHRQLAAGIGSLEAVMPLTAARIHFKVKYTTEFDENGVPVRAYGSATPIE